MSIQSLNPQSIAYARAYASSAYKLTSGQETPASTDNFAALITPAPSAPAIADRVDLSPVAAKTLETSAKPLRDYNSLDAWKKDREGVFLQYQEAGNKVKVSGMSVHVTGKNEYLSSKNDPRNLGSWEERFAGNPYMIKMMESLSRHNNTDLVENMPENSMDYTLSEDQIKEQYGNYFVHKMEESTDLIGVTLQGIQHHEDRLIELGRRIGDDGGNAVFERIADDTQNELERQRGHLHSELDDLARWAEINGVEEDASQFFAEYTEKYFGQKLNLQDLQNITAQAA